jgi:peptidyl-prolyl cis-trans isomerase D
MIEWMRKHMGWLMWIIIILVVVTFMFFGIGGSQTSGTAMAKVGDYTITSDEVNRVYQNLRETYREALKDQKGDQLDNALRQQALQELVVNRLMIDEAEHQGLSIGDEELQAYILAMPAFQRDGKFDKQMYDRILDRINMSPAVFESSQRELLLRRKLENLVKDSVAVSEKELQDAYYMRNPKAKPADYAKNKASFGETYMAGKQRDALTAYLRNVQGRVAIKILDKGQKTS